jgi:hypothetical protein
LFIAFYRGRREAEVVGMGRAEVVNGVLNGAVTEVEGEEMWPSKGGGGGIMGGLDWLGPLHGCNTPCS